MNDIFGKTLRIQSRHFSLLINHVFFLALHDPSAKGTGRKILVVAVNFTGSTHKAL